MKPNRYSFITALAALVIVLATSQPLRAAEIIGHRGASADAPENSLSSVKLAWEQQAAYFFQRVIQHGRRRSEEVREVAETVREAGLTPWSAAGTAERQAWVADQADAGLFGDKAAPDFAKQPDWRTEADRILAHVKPTS